MGKPVNPLPSLEKQALRVCPAAMCAASRLLPSPPLTPPWLVYTRRENPPGFHSPAQAAEKGLSAFVLW